MSTPSFQDQVAIVTGGNAGIGRATALAFAREGARVVVAGRREAEGEAVVREIEQAGSEGLFVRTDVAKERDVQALVEQTLARFGRLDCAFNNAGVGQFMPLVDTTDEAYDQQMNINVRGVFYCLKHQLPVLLKQGSGAIVNNASALGLVAMPNAAVYNATKFAVIGLTKTAALEAGKGGVRVNAVCPGVIETEINAELRDNPEMKTAMLAMHPVGRFGQAEEVAAAVLYLCGPHSRFTTGVALPVDGGWTAQ